MSTPHNSAEKGAFAKTVLMPGDPLRAKFIAETYLEEPKLVNNVRGIQGYTGTYKGVPVSVMASGMGMPSMAIYSYELFNMYGVENILRVGSAGAVSMELKLRDIVLGQGACTSSSMQDNFGVHGHFAPIADFDLLRCAAQICEERGLRYKAGNLISSDIFYNDDPAFNQPFLNLGALAVEMEAAALYMNAARAGKRALAICTISDHVLTGEATSAEERQTTFNEMMELALEVAVRMNDK
ncbi:MAG: purine-nucleoside phosphorylase [Firmicutes bacterium]|nr:purine-nucleoside phosphorylase [Bacillota bacterium]MBQ1475828.1 purine-nucleoside phosphorylase [Bacillota bacterium]MBQ1579974.1 purine-nucleoside phosphorylase [Bacillota bacterium]MBQ2146783.1 purine-nucleoside phosphorylase [Bacillota bacterium]MBQ2228485.1 purine-nucleoside phosphorylase [Bacillota bacterium]